MAGLIALIGSQVMMMEAPKYWVMALARIIQGISSSVVWTTGLALLYVVFGFDCFVSSKGSRYY